MESLMAAEEIYYGTDLEEEGTVCQGGAAGVTQQGRCRAQRERREKLRICGGLYWQGGHRSIYQQEIGGDFTDMFEYQQVTGREGQEGELVAGTSLITLVHLITWARCSQPVCRKIRSLKIYNANTNFPGLLRLAPSGVCVNLLVYS